MEIHIRKNNNKDAVIILKSKKKKYKNCIQKINSRFEFLSAY